MLTSEPARAREIARQLIRTWREHNLSSENERPDLVVGLAASFTADPLVPLLGGRLLDRAARHPTVLNANYNQLSMVCINPAAEFGGTLPDVIAFLWRLEDLTSATDANLIEDAFGNFVDQLRRLRNSFGGTIIIALPPRPRVVDDVVEFSKPSAIQQIWHRALVTLSEFLATSPDTFTIDIEEEIGRLGASLSMDIRYEYMYRQPYTEQLYLGVADQLVRVCEARRSHAKKCVVVDCDNTLWGGVIGEDGIGGLTLSEEYPGRAFRDFQKQLKRLSESGIFVALATKNNPAEVEEVFRENSAMVLRWEDLSSTRINWRPKSENIREIAHELNIGLDAVVFVDDNLFELEEVRTHLPEVLCIQVPEETAEFPETFLRACRHFDRLVLSQEDTRRVQMVRSETERRELHQKLTEAEFLSTLDLKVKIRPAGTAELARVTQLINKTNQFNLTTRRYSFEEVVSMASDPSALLYSASVSDRFGDYGLVGVGIVRFMPDGAVFDTVLMSCRVLGRGIESALLQYGIREASNRGYASIEAHYIPTRKNAMVGDLLSQHGFERREVLRAGGEAYDRPTTSFVVPDYLALDMADGTPEHAVG